MKLYDLKTKEIVNKDLVENSAEGKALSGYKFYPDKLTDDELISCGYKRVIDAQIPKINDKFKTLKLIGEEKDKVYELNYKAVSVSLPMAKKLKSEELASWAMDMVSASKVNLKGFGVIDAGYNYIANAEAMINNFDLLPEKVFRMYDNSFKEVTKEQLIKVKKAIEVAGIKIHALKWGYEDAIAKAASVSAVKDIVFNDVIEVDLGDL